MNFKVYLKKSTGEKLVLAAKSLRRSCHSIVKEAIEEWLRSHAQKSWPKNFFDFSPIDVGADYREWPNDLKSNISEDPLA